MSATGTLERVSISNEDFVKKCVEAHKQGKGTKWIADELKMKTGTVTQRRALLKQKGINLPELGSRAGSKTDAASLNKIIAEMTNTPIKDIEKASEQMKGKSKSNGDK